MEEIKKHMGELSEELNKMMNEIDSCDKVRLLQLSKELDDVIYEYIQVKKKCYK